MNFNKRDSFPKEKYPFSDELCNFMDSNPDFYNSLKISRPERFVFIPIIFTSHTPSEHCLTKDEVIGMWYYDQKKTKFKQDFIINKNKENKEFISYTAITEAKKYKSKYVQVINDFFEKYGKNGTYYHNGNKWQHHYRDIDDLPNEPNLKFLAAEIQKEYANAKSS